MRGWGVPLRGRYTCQVGIPLAFQAAVGKWKRSGNSVIEFPILSLIGIVWPGRKTFRKIFRTISNSLSFGLREVARSLRGIARPAYNWRMQPRGRLFISRTERRNDFRSIRT